MQYISPTTLLIKLHIPLLLRTRRFASSGQVVQVGKMRQSRAALHYSCDQAPSSHIDTGKSGFYLIQTKYLPGQSTAEAHKKFIVRATLADVNCCYSVKLGLLLDSLSVGLARESTAPRTDAPCVCEVSWPPTVRDDADGRGPARIDAPGEKYRKAFVRCVSEHGRPRTVGTPWLPLIVLLCRVLTP